MNCYARSARPGPAICFAWAMAGPFAGGVFDRPARVEEKRLVRKMRLV